MMTKEELVASTDAALLDMADKSKGHIGKDLGETMDNDFSQGFRTGELQKRGYKNGWYKEQINEQIFMVIYVIHTAKTVRKAYTVLEIAEKWSAFTRGVLGRVAAFSGDFLCLVNCRIIIDGI